MLALQGLAGAKLPNTLLILILNNLLLLPLLPLPLLLLPVSPDSLSTMQVVYDNSPRGEYRKAGGDPAKEYLIMGGEAAMWSEQVRLHTPSSSPLLFSPTHPTSSSFFLLILPPRMCFSSPILILPLHPKS